MEYKHIHELMELMHRFNIEEMDYTSEKGERIRLKGASSLPVHLKPAPAELLEEIVHHHQTKQAVHSIHSPMVGTVYFAPSPTDPPYVQKGMVVSPDTVVCIVEAMKVMNEIKAGVHGIIEEILLVNGSAVEFGTPLFHVKKQ